MLKDFPNFSSHKSMTPEGIADVMLRLEARVPVGVQPAVWSLSLFIIAIAALSPGPSLVVQQIQL